jgi:tellurite resistance protein
MADTPLAFEDVSPDALSRLVSVLAEDAVFVLAASPQGGREALETTAKRRIEAYVATLRGVAPTRLTSDFDRWVVELATAMAGSEPPVWLPMNEVLREKVTLAAGPRGLRALFSSKPSDKDVARVKRLGSLTARALKAVFAADGALNDDESRALRALVASLGLPDEDTASLLSDPPTPAEQLDVYGDIDAPVARAIVRGAWLGAAWDMIDPREEQVVRMLAQKLGVSNETLEAARADAIARVDARKVAAFAAVDGVRFVLSDLVPGVGVELPTRIAQLVVPRRYREEALAPIGAGSPVVLARRHASLSVDDRAWVLALVWAAALAIDPSVSRRAVLRSRFGKVAEDLGDDGRRARALLNDWIDDELENAARTLNGR